jgi:hypothetical protein
MKTLKISLGAVLALACVAAAPMQAAESSGKRVCLFDGKTLKGWTVLTCEATVDNGDLFLKAGNGVVQSERKYGDFVFECEWKALKPEKWDSGIYFRYDTIAPKRPWPARYQANLRQGDECNVGGLKGAKSEGLTKPGEWNRLKMTVRGTCVEMEINGKPAWKADGLEGPKEGFIALQAEVPGGGQYRFRNIYITELK